MTEEEIKLLIRQELPKILQEDRDVRDFVLRTVENLYAGKQGTESRFDQILAELQRDRIEQRQNFHALLEEVKQVNRKHDSTIGALGARWGLYSETSFRNALQGILTESFGVKVLNVTEYDDQGEVFGRPDQIELDLIIKNGLLIVCEIKSSMSKPDMYIFEKKVRFYQTRHQQTVTRKIVISPMVHPKALETAQKLGIEVYNYAENVEV